MNQSVEAVVSLTPNGSLRGKVGRASTTDDVRPVYEFLGVPYAQPPVGPRRFQPPEPFPLWTGERTATEFGPRCPQISLRNQTKRDIPMSEDCLYLNVWTPFLKPTSQLATIVFIHGGAFAFGSGGEHRGNVICSYHDVVFVSINYRLGVFGFLSTGDDVCPGNNGLLDQIEALRWVRAHIRVFGGDPNNVTIMGESAGGMSVTWLMTSPLANGLFKRGISQSGTANMPRFIHTRHQAELLLKKQLAAKGVSWDSSQQILNYLRNLSSQSLLKTMGDKFRPVVGGHVISDVMVNRYKEQSTILNGELLLGCNPRTFVWAFSLLDFNLFKLKLSDKKAALDVICNHVGKVMGITRDHEMAEQFGRLAADVYLRDVREGDSAGIKEAVTQFYTDCFFFVPIDETARLHSERKPTYFYIFDHQPSLANSAAWEQEHLYSLGLPFVHSKAPFQQEERQLSKTLMSYWVNFARTGNPNGSGLPVWPRYNRKDREYLTLCEAPCSGKRHLDGDRERFWRNDASLCLTTGLVSKY